MKKGDLILIGILLLVGIIGVVALTATGGGDGDYYVVVESEGAVLHRLPLSVDTELLIEHDGGYNLLVISGGRAAIREASCKNQVCVKTGYIDAEMSAASILCSPNGLLVYLEKE